MCNFDDLNESGKKQAHEDLMTYVNAFGGANFFLQFLEAIRKSKPHPLMAKNSNFRSPTGTIGWNKVIFKDKLDLLMSIRKSERKKGNLLPDKHDKNYKNIHNLLRTLYPIEFVIKPKDEGAGKEFTIQAFNIINDDITLLNPIFDAIFFCSIETTKKVINYK